MLLKLQNFREEERAAYEVSLKIYRDNHNVIETARAEGQKEAVLSIAAKMKEQGIALEQITEITGLSLTEIKNL